MMEDMEDRELKSKSGRDFIDPAKSELRTRNLGYFASR